MRRAAQVLGAMLVLFATALAAAIVLTVTALLRAGRDAGR